MLTPSQPREASLRFREGLRLLITVACLFAGSGICHAASSRSEPRGAATNAAAVAAVATTNVATSAAAQARPGAAETQNAPDTSAKADAAAKAVAPTGPPPSKH